MEKQLLYLYDLPKDLVTSVKICEALKTSVKETSLDGKPQIKRDINKLFYTAVVKFSDPEDFRKASKELKYFEIDKKPCRALPFDKDLLGSNRASTNKYNNVFVKGLARELTAKELEKLFQEKVGPVKTSKVSINEDHSSRGYGFVCFESAEAAQKAIKLASEMELKDGLEEIKDLQILVYNPKDRSQIKSRFNNIYMKNFPPSWDEAILRQRFEKFGQIKSLVLKYQGKEGETKAPFAFVCYDDENDKDYGSKCANEAVAAMHGLEVEGYIIYASQFLSKSDRELEKKKEQMRFKQSKKRCNLYVKNFPATTTEAELKELFEKMGEIESVKIFSKEEGEALYAFVCYKSPDSAAAAKNTFHSSTFNGKTLYINHYEIKEIRRIQQEEMRDNADYQNYKKQNSQGSLNMDVFNRPELFGLIQQLMIYMQRMQGHQRGGNMQYRQNRQGGRPNNGQQHQGPYNQNKQMNPMYQQPNQQFNQPRSQPQMANPGQMPIPTQQMIPQQQMMIAQATPGIPPFIQAYNIQGAQLMPAVVPQNPNYKGQVGEFIYEYVEKIAGEEKAPKITGMLIDLPIEEIKQYLADFPKLQFKINEASNLLQSQ